jgi:hypothetical protein
VVEGKIPLGGKDPLSRFNIIYANLPMKERVQIVAVINDQPISWEMAHREINNKTKLGEEILKVLIKLKIL